MELRNPDELDFFFSWLLLLAFCREKISGVKARRRGNYAGARTLRFTFPFPAAAVRPSFRPPRRLPDMRDRAAGRSVPHVQGRYGPGVVLAGFASHGLTSSPTQSVSSATESGSLDFFMFKIT
jgi:hypothetical protein